MLTKDSIRCDNCGELRNRKYYPNTASPFFPDGVAHICQTCLMKLVPGDNFPRIDKFCQWMDIPFLPNEWEKLWAVNKEQTLMLYCDQYGGSSRETGMDWASINQEMIELKKNGLLRETIEIFTEETHRRWAELWGGGYNEEEYEYMTAQYDEMLRARGTATPQQKEQARFIVMNGIIIRNGLRDKKDMKSFISSYNTLIASGGFQPENATNYGDFESFGEAINYLVRTGYKPKFYDGKNRDEIDFTIKNQQLYLRRLVANEPSLPELIVQRKDRVRVAASLEEEGLDDESLDKFEADGYEIEYEGEEDFEAELRGDKSDG